jgi:predicted metal-dependent hydrolase
MEADTAMEVNRTVDLRGETVTYQVRRSAEASQIRIDAGLGGIRLVLPEDSTADPDAIIEEKAGWVLDKQAQYARYRAEMPERCFEEDEEFPILGTRRRVEVRGVPEPEVTEEAIRLPKARVEKTSIREVLEGVYRSEAREHFTRRAGHFCEKMSVSYEQIQIRNQKTRWGSYSQRTGTLSLNFRLLMAPPEVVDYVIAHELAHAEHPNHGPRFWRLVAEHVPGHEERDDWLDENGHRLGFDRTPA